MLKLTLKFTLKYSYMFRFNKPSSGSSLPFFAEVISILIIMTLAKHNIKSPDSGFGGLGLGCCLQNRRKPSGFFRAKKKSSARLPSEGK